MNDRKMVIGEWVINFYEGSQPKEMMIEITTKCNMSCIYCFRRYLPSIEIGSMDFDLYKKIINEASEIGVSKVSFSGWGEPLVHDRILEFIEYAKRKGLEVLLNTNGYYLPEYADDIIKLGVDEIVVSMDSPYEDTYSIMRRGGDLARIVDGLLRIKELRYKLKLMLKPRVYIQFTLTRKNYKNLMPMVKLASELAVARIIVSNIIPLDPDQEREYACYIDEECIRAVEDLRLEVAKMTFQYNVDAIFPNMNLRTERSCPFVSRAATYIRFDGLVAPCIYYAHKWRNTLYGITRDIEPVIFGDLRESKLIEVWRDPKYVRFRFMAFFMYQPSCLDCRLREYCLITLSNKYDCWGNEPTCAHCPYSRDLVRCPL